MGFPLRRQLLGTAVTLLRIHSAGIQLSQNQQSNTSASSPPPSCKTLMLPSFALPWLEVYGEPLHGAQ